jgi:putative transposase
MTDYRRFYIPGSTWFFTVNLAERRDNRLLLEQIDLPAGGFSAHQTPQAFPDGRGRYHAGSPALHPDTTAR